MPMLPKKMCGVPGCTQLAETGSGYCINHSKFEKLTRINSFDRLYNTARWREMRSNHLSRHPLCVSCLKAGRLTPATECDHIKPHKGDRSLFFDTSNLQSLCKPCHSAKTAREDGGWGRAKAPEGGDR